MSDPEIDYTVLNWIASNHSDHELLKSMNISGELQEVFKRLGKIEYDEVKALRGIAIKLEVDPMLLRHQLNRLEERRSEDDLLRRAIQLGAPSEVLKRYMGISKKEHYRLKKRYGVISNDFAEMKEGSLFQLWVEQAGNPEHPSLADLVIVSERNRIAISHIWRFVKRWNSASVVGLYHEH